MREVDRRSKHSRRVFLQRRGDDRAGPSQWASSTGLGYRRCLGRRRRRAFRRPRLKTLVKVRARHLPARHAGRQLLHHRGQNRGTPKGGEKSPP